MERNRRRKFEGLSIPATIRVKTDTGKVKVFRRGDLIELLSVPSKRSERHRMLEAMPSIMGFWNYYAEIYRSRYETMRRAYETFEADLRGKIERAIIANTEGQEHLGREFATPQNVSSIYYSDASVIERRERVERAKGKYHVIKLIADVLKEKNWNLRTLAQTRDQD